MQPFHIILHRAPQSLPAIRNLNEEFSGHSGPAGIPDQLSEPLPVTFEQAIDALQALPRMFIEPDGSFVWVAEVDSEPWQLDGQLHDGLGHLATVEIKGQVGADRWSQLVQCFGSENVPLLVQFVREGRFMTELEFRHDWLSNDRASDKE